MPHLSGLILMVFLALAFVAPMLGDPLLRSIEKRAARFAARKRAAIVVVALTTIVARLALLPLLPVPVPAVHDEFSYLLAADTFAHGRLANLPHPMWLFLDTFHVQQHPTYASIFPPAQAGALAVGQLLGHPWIGVLLSMALMCAALTWMLQGWFSAEWALVGGVLALVRFGLFSYWVNSYWGGALAGTGGAMVLGAFPRIIHHRRSRDAIVLGVGAGLLANSRPVEGLVFCIPLAVALIAWLFSRSGPPFNISGPRILLPFLCVMLPVLTFIGYYNWQVTGRPLLFPHALFMRQQCNCPVFAWQKLHSPLHYTNSQFDYFYNVHVRRRYVPSWNGWKKRSLEGINGWWHTFLGLTLSSPFMTLPWLLPDRRIRLIIVQFCLCVSGLLVMLYLEPHYAAPLGATLFVLLVQAMRHLRRWNCCGRPVGIGLSRLVVLAVVANVPLYMLARMRYVEPEAWNVSRARVVKQLEATPGLHLVIVNYAPNHIVHNEWVYNAADIDRSKVVWARKIPGRDLQPLLDYFHGRSVWLVEADASPPHLQPYTAGQTETK